MTAPDQPEFKRAWKVVFASFCISAAGVSAAFTYTFGAFIKPLAADFGWSRGQSQGFFVFLTIGILLGAPLVGWLVERIGVRRVILMSAAAFAAATATMALTTQALPLFYAFGFLIAFMGAGTTSVAFNRAIVVWFDRKRGLAMGIAISGSGLFSILGPVYVTWLVESYGWRAGFFGLALLPAFISLPITFLFLRMPPAAASASTPERVRQGPGVRAALTSRRFWCICLSFFMFGMGTGGLFPNLMPLLTDQGLTPQRAAQIASLSGFAIIASRLGAGYLVDRIWAPLVTAILVGTPSILCVAMALWGGNQIVIILFTISIGMAAGSEFDLVGYLVSRYFDLKNYSAIYGILYGLFTTASGIAPPIYGAMFDALGNYTLALMVAGACFAGGAALILTLGPYPKRE
ncbi:MAG: MFS transporter [Rhodospirillaceae bacterium]|nr:MFS transporter [Rhodospirillaceae bacterium]